MNDADPNPSSQPPRITSAPPTISAPERLAFLKRYATIFKMVGVAVLILLLLIPLNMVSSVLRERLGRRNEAVTDITSSWGRDQKLVGPVLIVPYRYPVKAWKEQPAADGRIEKREVVDMLTANACFLPTNLAITGDIKPMQLRRGIYQAVVYTGKLEFSGEFAPPDFGRLRIKPEDVLWDEALVAFAIPDLRGVKETLSLNWNEKPHPLLPGNKLGASQSGVFATVGDLRGGEAPIPFRLALSLNGSGALSFAPLGSQTTVKLVSSWPDPSFFGAWLPAERKVGRDGFEATWQVSYYGRNFPQQWACQTPEPCLLSSGIESSLLGVNFLSVIDTYRNTERAIKYGVLFMVLIFAAFFLFEVLAALKIHPFQYAIVGAALCLFYLGLLSLSEFIPFGLAYLAAAGATMLLICFHSVKMLKSGGRTFIVAGLLAAIYGFLYVALQLQDYALLLGTGGLFAALALVIWLTRNIDWYARDRA